MCGTLRNDVAQSKHSRKVIIMPGGRGGVTGVEKCETPTSADFFFHLIHQLWPKKKKRKDF